MNTHIYLHIAPSQHGEPTKVTAIALKCKLPADGDSSISEAIIADTDTGLVARAMLQSAAYLFAQGQPVSFGQEIPIEVLK